MQRWLQQMDHELRRRRSRELERRQPRRASRWRPRRSWSKRSRAIPGYYTSKFFLRPHYQLEGLTVSLRLVSKLPSVKSGVVPPRFDPPLKG